MNILIVDDSKMFRHILNNTLKELGYEHIQEAGNVSEAKRILRRDEIGLILSDWNMPGESGLDLLKWIHSNSESAQIPFIIISTESEKANIFKAIKEGVQAYLIKPVKRDQLYDKLEALVKTHGIVPPCSLTPVQVAKESSYSAADTGAILKDDIRSIENAPHLGIRLDSGTCVMSVEALQQENLSELIPVLFPGARYLYITSSNVENKYNANIKIWKDSMEQ